MKKTIIPLIVMMLLLVPSVFAYDLNVTIDVVEAPVPLTGYVFGGWSVQFISGLLAIGFIFLIVKFYLADFKINKDFVDKTFIIVIIGLVLASMIGVLYTIG